MNGHFTSSTDAMLGFLVEAQMKTVTLACLLTRKPAKVILAGTFSGKFQSLRLSHFGDCQPPSVVAEEEIVGGSAWFGTTLSMSV